MTGPGRHDEKTAFLEVWQRVSAGLTAIRAGLDQLPPRGRAELDRIFRDLEFQHARLLAEVDSMPATTVAGIAFVERAIDELRALENRIGGLARFARPAPAPEPPRSLSSPAFPVGSPMPSGDRYSAIVNELEAAFSRAEIARPMDGHYASQQRPGAPYPAPFQHPVQIVYVPHPMPPQHRRRRSDDEADGEASGMRRKSSTSVRPHRNADETP